MYCVNDPCETEATHYYDTPKGLRIYLCTTCAQAFEWGQTRPEVAVNRIESEDGVEAVYENCGAPCEYDSELCLCIKCERDLSEERES